MGDARPPIVTGRPEVQRSALVYSDAMDPTTDDQADLRIQLGTALLGTIGGAVRALRARVAEPDTLMLIAYFDRDCAPRSE